MLGTYRFFGCPQWLKFDLTRNLHHIWDMSNLQSRFLPKSFNAWWQRQHPNVRGGMWMLMGAFMFSVMVTIIKIIGSRISIFEILFFRQLAMTIIVAPVIIRGLPNSLKTQMPGLQALRVVAATSAMIMGFSAFIHLPLSTATAIGFSKTMFITILAIIFLKETVGIRRWSAVVVGFVGVIIMIAPEDGWSEFANFDIWSLAALASAACAGLVMVIIRKLSQVDQAITILSFQAIFVGLLMIVPTLYFWVTPTLEEWLWMGLLGLVSVIAQTANIRAYKAGEATAISTIDYTRLVYASILGFLIFAEIPDLNTMIGALVIIAASLYTLHREGQQGKALARSKEGRTYN